jgi:Tfp pilus assembly protein PilF
MNARRSAAVALAALMISCANGGAVERAYDGHVIEGRYVRPEAYAAFQRGAMAEASRDAKQALAAYSEAVRIDPRGVEIWTRMGDLRCRGDVRDAQADASFARALHVEATYAPVWAAKARCALARGDVAGARVAALRAAELDPLADGANVLLASTAASTENRATRAALLALTVTARDPLVAWDALATWAEARGDVALWARALRELVRIAPARREEVAHAAEALAGLGETEQAHRVAAAAADADEQPLRGDHALAARLAVDEAIANDDTGAVSRRATRVRLPLDEAAGRALLQGHRAMARELASSIARADPEVRGAQLVLAACGGDVLYAAYRARPEDQAPSAAAFVAFGVALVHATSREQARAKLGGLAHAAIVAGDDRVVRPAVELASRGVLAPDALPPDGMVELAALRAEAPPEALVASRDHALDARHEYLALALAHPQAARTGELATQLAGAAGFDPIVAAASALIQLATGKAIPAAAAGALLARNAGDPLLAVTALRLAEKAGDHEGVRRARAALTALGDGFHESVE